MNTLHPRRSQLMLAARFAAVVLLLGCTSRRASEPSPAARKGSEADPVCPAGYLRYAGFETPTAIGASAKAVFERLGPQRTFALSVECGSGAPCNLPDRKVELTLRYAGAALCAGRDCNELYPDLLFETVSAEQRARCPRALLTYGKLRIATDAGAIALELDAQVLAHSTSDIWARSLERASPSASLAAALGGSGRSLDLDLEVQERAGSHQGVLDVVASRNDPETGLTHMERLARFAWSGRSPE